MTTEATKLIRTFDKSGVPRYYQREVLGDALRQLEQEGGEATYVQEGSKMESGSCETCKQLEAKVARLERAVDPQGGGHLEFGSDDQYTPHRYTSEDAAHGGDIPLDPDTIETGTGPGEVATLDILGAERGRANGTNLCAVYLDADPALDDDLFNIRATLRINNTPHPSFRSVPLVKVTPTTDGRIQRIQLGNPYHITAGDSVAIVLDAASSLNATSDGDVRGGLETGDRCGDLQVG